MKKDKINSNIHLSITSEEEIQHITLLYGDPDRKLPKGVSVLDIIKDCLTEDEYKEIIGTESVIASGFIILFEKKQLFLDCYFYHKKNYLAFCDGSYIYEIRLDMLLIKKTTDKLVFKDPFFDYSNTNITKNKKFPCCKHYSKGIFYFHTSVLSKLISLALNSGSSTPLFFCFK